MTESAPSRGQIRWFDCCLEGKSIKGRTGIPHHMFLILTNSDYNTKSNHFSGLPITSKKSTQYQYFLMNYGFDITNDDITGDLVFEKESCLLCDRPVRLDKKDLITNQDSTGKIKEGILVDILLNVNRFLRSGKIILKS